MPIRPQRYDNFLKNAIKRKILSLYILMKHSFARYLCLLAMLFFSAAGFADDFTLKGKVVDEDGQALELVPRKRVFRRPKGKMTVQIVMYPMEALQEITVTERRRQTTQTEQLNTKDLKIVPSISGNAVEELIQQQAGVSTHNELSSQYNVRGGSFDENSVYINGVEIYRPLLVSSGQQEGLSIINPDMVESIGFSTGGFAAKYGDKMSSALDITYRKPKRLEGTITGSLLGATGYLGYGNKTFSMSHGLRYKTNKYLLGSLETSGEYQPNFFDYQTYITYRPNKRWEVELIGYISENHYNFTPESRETSFGTIADAKSFKVYFDGQEKDVFRTYFGTASIARSFGDSTKIKFLTSAFHTKEKETYDIAGQYWLDDAQSSENLGVGTYMEHARNYLTADVVSFKLVGTHKTRRHDIEAGLTYKIENIKETSREYEMRDSSGYSIPHVSQERREEPSHRGLHTGHLPFQQGRQLLHAELWRPAGELVVQQRDHRVAQSLAGPRARLQPRLHLPLCHRTLLPGAVLQRDARHGDNKRTDTGGAQREHQKSAIPAVHRSNGLSLQDAQSSLQIFGRSIFQGFVEPYPV